MTSAWLPLFADGAKAEQRQLEVPNLNPSCSADPGSGSARKLFGQRSWFPHAIYLSREPSYYNLPRLDPVVGRQYRGEGGVEGKAYSRAASRLQIPQLRLEIPEYHILEGSKMSKNETNH